MAATRPMDAPLARRMEAVEALGMASPERLLLPLLLFVTFVSHAYHMFSYPLYLGDEGIYTGQAWAVLKGIGLTPYTYTYDHAPAGWLLIAAWLRLLPRGVAQWGMAENSGRVLMLLLALASTALLYRLARRLTGSSAAAALAGVIFALSPLSLYYGRMVLLDNIMVFWLLLSLDLLTEGRGLFALLASGAAFGIAMLSKENAVFFTPVVAYALYAASREQHFYRFGVAGWLYVSLAIISLYPLFAYLKGEFLPGPGHVSLLQTGIAYQIGRTTPNGSILNFRHSPSGGFWAYVHTTWADKDPIILIAGTAAILFNIAIAILRPQLRRTYLIAVALAAVYAFYIARGAVLLEFYIVPLLPFLALNIALAAQALVRPAPRLAGTVALLGAVLALGVVFTRVEHRGRDAFAVQQTYLQADQLAYVRQHIPTNAIVMTDDDLWTDLHDGDNGRYAVYPYAYPYHTITGDPAVNGIGNPRRTPINKDWRNIQYIVASNKMAEVLRHDPTDHNGIALNAYRHSRPMQVWRLGQVMVQVRKVDPALPALPLSAMQ